MTAESIIWTRIVNAHQRVNDVLRRIRTIKENHSTVFEVVHPEASGHDFGVDPPPRPDGIVLTRDGRIVQIHRRILEGNMKPLLVGHLLNGVQTRHPAVLATIQPSATRSRVQSGTISSAVDSAVKRRLINNRGLVGYSTGRVIESNWRPAST